MKIYCDRSIQTQVKGIPVFLDNNVLNFIFDDKELLTEVVALFSGCDFLIDPNIRFEFLRDHTFPEQLKRREAFISTEPFILMPNHHEITGPISENALILSRLLRFAGQKSSPAFDLLLLGRIMLYSTDCLFLTGDFADFDLKILDRLNVISIENERGATHWQLLKFNREKYNQLQNTYESFKAKVQEQEKSAKKTGAPTNKIV